MSKLSKHRTAKKKIIEQINKKDINFTPSMDRAIRWWKILNQAAFKEKLVLPKIEIRQLKKACGRCDIKTGGLPVIAINHNIKSRNLFIATLAHEMVHQHQWMTVKNLDHGNTFKIWKRYFKRYFKIDI